MTSLPKSITRAHPQDPVLPAAGWRRPAFLFLLLGQFISMIGSQLSVVALPWFVLSTTGSPGKMTVVLLAGSLPVVLFGIPAGALVDRVDLKRLLMRSDLARGVVTMLIPTLALTGHLEFWMIVAVSFLGGVLVTPYMGARMALLPVLVGERTADLARANTLFQFTAQLSSILGPALAGLLIAWLGNINVLFLDAASFFLTASLIGLGVHYRRPDPTASSKSSVKEPWLQEIRAGTRFIWQQAFLRDVVAIGMFASLAFTVLDAAALPVFVKDVLGGTPRQLGWLLSTWGLGSVAGMIVYGSLAGRWPWSPQASLRFFLIGMVLPIWLFPLMPGFGPALFSLALSGLCVAPTMIIIQTSLQTATPANLRGRVFSTFNALWQVVTPLGFLLAGPLLERYGALPVLWLVALLLSGCLIAGWASPSFRDA